MAGIFDKKYFNNEVFGKYLDTLENPKLNKFMEAGIFATRNDLKGMLTDQTGGNYIVLPMKGRIGGDPVNYDGDTNITATGLGTYKQGMVVVGRAKAWLEKDFAVDVTSEDFMDDIASQVGDYWAEIDQDTILSTLKGIYATSNDFVTNHTYDITSETTKTVGATTLNSAIQKASGDKKEKFKVVIAHSVVATNLENANVVEYLKYTDSKGVERELGLGTWNGRLLLVDDGVGANYSYTSGGVYTVEVGGTIAEGDKLTVLDKTVTADSDDTATDLATAMVTALGTLDDYTVNRSTSTITFTEKSGHYGAGAPNASIESTAGTVTVATTTAPVYTASYNTYVLGENAFTYADIGAKVPSETDRDAKTDGGIDYLITRQRKVFAPYGFSFKANAMSSDSPTKSELESGSSWEIVKDTDGNPIPHKLIPIAKIVSQG